MTTRDFSRADEMQELRFAAKWTLQQIADKFGITRERVRQILGNTGSGYKTARHQKIVDENKKATNSKLLQLLGFAKSTASLARYRKGERHEIEGGWAKIGAAMEDYVSQELSAHGIKNQLMPHGHIFDVLLDNGLRCDVKSGQAIKALTHDTPTYSFQTGIYRKGHYCDFLILVLRETKDIFVVPEKECTGIIRFAYPEPIMGKKSKWLQYHNRFDLLKGANAA